MSRTDADLGVHDGLTLSGPQDQEPLCDLAGFAFKVDSQIALEACATRGAQFDQVSGHTLTEVGL